MARLAVDDSKLVVAGAGLLAVEIVVVVVAERTGARAGVVR